MKFIISIIFLFVINVYANEFNWNNTHEVDEKEYQNIKDMVNKNYKIRNSEVVKEYLKIEKEKLFILDKYGNIYEEIKSPYTRRIWLDRNLGAKRVCQSYDDEQCYGYYLNWDEAKRTCPIGYKLPSKDELQAETRGISNRDDAFNSFLMLPSAGNRNFYNVSENYVGSYGGVWSSSPVVKTSWYLYFGKYTVDWSSNDRANGWSVRCMKD